jgi:hypothetical protein
MAIVFMISVGYCGKDFNLIILLVTHIVIQLTYYVITCINNHYYY